ncbi:isopeptide-forming domain-containing fimbrial protein [Scytonema sp. UIC 10036]|uniref:isopeptide-forming domain-containing fimbrial protein n=1 Tax=Scytonema sp. UIC 10036 TaxID=2304196 RepID=UPI001FA9B40B|nr:isopeptide-forming domain-containing fimbrial protein [Scytonema sp. UIC 10036]
MEIEPHPIADERRRTHFIGVCLRASAVINKKHWFGWFAIAVPTAYILCNPITALAQTKNLINQATYTYTDSNTNSQFQGISSQIDIKPIQLIDPQGRILGCNGQPLSDYNGFSVGLYETNSNDPTGTELGRLVSLTPTELPDIPNNAVARGVQPNTTNNNPFVLTNSSEGKYNFLLDPSKGQVTPGKTYILVVNPPENSIYSQRRIKISILESAANTQNNVVRYLAASLDGQPISITGETSYQGTVVLIPNAELVGLNLFAFEFDVGMCQTQQVQIIKTGDRATAEPGDTVIYRLSVKNKSDAALNELVITDTLPLGFTFISKSVRGEFDRQAVTVTVEGQGATVRLRTSIPIPPNKVLNIAYAAQLSPDSVRGSGRNSAIVNAQRVDNNFAVKDGPATHQLKVRPGIVSDCGTIIGRVFVDKNFDGEQQTGEPGVPNAVIFLEDGNRITTDVNGLFSVANVLPGNHTGVLDLSSLSGYTLAPNLYFRERNSQSRLVRLEPGGMVRMNFAVTPAFHEEVEK